MIQINDGFYCPTCLARRPDPQNICHGKDHYVLAPATFYKSPLPSLVHNFKYRRLEKISKILSVILITYIKKSQLDTSSFLTTFIPLHFHKERKRGFNQSEEIAKIFCQYFNIPLVKTLKRIKNTKSQAQIKNNQKRAENISNSFLAINPENVKGKSFILIDDISTSGATLKEASKILKENGARKIIGLVVAKA
jgi:ComF family protein